jgi:hypothetical protein
VGDTDIQLDDTPEELDAWQREQTNEQRKRAGLPPLPSSDVDDAKYGSEARIVAKLSQAEMDAKVQRMLSGE